MNNKKAQVTIFIIVGVVIVVLILAFFFLREKVIPTTEIRAEKNPEAFLESCIIPKVKEKAKIISENGGYLEIPFYAALDGKNISFLCYTQNYYRACINQEPMLLKHLKEELQENIQTEIESCFTELKNNLEKQGYSISIGTMNYDVVLIPKKIIINIDRDLNIEKSGETSKYEKFKIDIPSRYYNLGVVAEEINGQEAEFCNFEHVGFMMLYQDYNITKFRKGDGVTVYTIQSRKTKEDFMFAVRSCIIPGGL